MINLVMNFMVDLDVIFILGMKFICFEMGYGYIEVDFSVFFIVNKEVFWVYFFKEKFDLEIVWCYI